MFSPGQIIHYLDMCNEEGANLQRGMNFHLRPGYSVILMSRRPNAPYADRVEDDGKTLIYEGHDVPKTRGVRDPKNHDQPMHNPTGTPTENGKFFMAAKEHKDKGREPERVRVYEKLYSGIWVYNGTFKLLDAWLEPSAGRKVFKFRLELAAEMPETDTSRPEQKVAIDLEHTRMIPSAVKLEVWKRDKGRCQHRGCGRTDNLHFDHIIPYSKGGTSLKAENIQLLCARHNLEKRDEIR